MAKATCIDDIKAHLQPVIIGGDILFRAEKSQVRYINLECIDIPVVVEWFFDLLDPVDL